MSNWWPLVIVKTSRACGVERILREAIRPVRTFPSLLGMVFSTAGIAIALGAWFLLAQNQAKVVAALNEMLRR